VGGGAGRTLAGPRLAHSVVEQLHTAAQVPPRSKPLLLIAQHPRLQQAAVEYCAGLDHMLRIIISCCFAAVLAAAASTEEAVSLRDHPISTPTAPKYLDGGAWTVSTLAPPSSLASGRDQPPQLAAKVNITIPATVPGDLITDLQRANVVPDPWLDTTWIQKSSLWSDHAWTYSTTFTVSEDAALGGTTTTLLVFDGVKLGATVRVNGHIVGVVRDQFLRYVFQLDAAALGLRDGGGNRLDVTFGVEDVAEDGRFMACTGGWDWAPYSYTSTNSSAASSGSAATFSKGIWKSVYLSVVPAGTAAITHVTPHTRYMGAYPTARLTDGKHGGFSVNVTAHLWAPAGGAMGSLSVAGNWAGAPGGGGGDSLATATSGRMQLPAGESVVSLRLKASAAQIRLWWPSGVGAQPLYNVTATFTPSVVAVNQHHRPGERMLPSSGASQTSRRIGFRVIALVTVNDTNVTIVASNASKNVTGQVNDTGTFGMFFRVNGAPIYSRGANMIPMEELEGRMDAEAHRILVKSSADAGMNTLR
jgi:beta-mannosidase